MPGQPLAPSVKEQCVKKPSAETAASAPPRRESLFIGESEATREALGRLERAAASEAPVFITGESGAGKELCARGLHGMSARADGPFVAVNCAAIARDLAESEFFGHARGAFTGALQARPGLVEMAHGGTLFLDEICEMDLPLQGKLLRFLETGLVRPVGADREKRVDARIVCATNRDPAREVREGRFRADLFWRLHVLPIALPPLRARGGDILLLAEHFLARFAREEGRAAMTISEEAAEMLLAHDWPGNVRELQNVLRQAVVFHHGAELTVSMLAGLMPATTAPAPQTAGRGLRLVEREAIEEAISHCGGSVPKAARMLGVAPSTIYRKRRGWLRARAV